MPGLGDAVGRTDGVDVGQHDNVEQAVGPHHEEGRQKAKAVARLRALCPVAKLDADTLQLKGRNVAGAQTKGWRGEEEKLISPHF